MEILCFGDSHTRYFKKSNMLLWEGVTSSATPRVTAFDFVAASAKGFSAGEKSRFAYKTLMRELSSRNPEFVCLGYGQVDAEVGFYFRKFVNDSDVSPEADLSAVYDGYIEMAQRIFPDIRLVFKGPNPSTLRNDHQLSINVFRSVTRRISNEDIRKTILAKIEDAQLTTSGHAAINCLATELLSEKVRKAGYDFFDIKDVASDPDEPGLAKWCYVPADSDVHLTNCYPIREAYHKNLFSLFK